MYLKEDYKEKIMLTVNKKERKSIPGFTSLKYGMSVKYVNIPIFITKIFFLFFYIFYIISMDYTILCHLHKYALT